MKFTITVDTETKLGSLLDSESISTVSQQAQMELTPKTALNSIDAAKNEKGPVSDDEMDSDIPVFGEGRDSPKD